MPNESKLMQADAIAIRQAIATGHREADLAREYGVTRATINLIKQNRLHANLGIDVSEMTRQKRSEQNAERFEQLLSEGKSAKEISEALGIGRSGVTRINTSSNPERHPSSVSIHTDALQGRSSTSRRQNKSESFIAKV